MRNELPAEYRNRGRLNFAFKTSNRLFAASSGLTQDEVNQLARSERYEVLHITDLIGMSKRDADIRHYMVRKLIGEAAREYFHTVGISYQDKIIYRKGDPQIKLDRRKLSEILRKQIVERFAEIDFEHKSLGEFVEKYLDSTAGR